MVIFPSATIADVRHTQCSLAMMSGVHRSSGGSESAGTLEVCPTDPACGWSLAPNTLSATATAASTASTTTAEAPIRTRRRLSPSALGGPTGSRVSPPTGALRSPVPPGGVAGPRPTAPNDASVVSAPGGGGTPGGGGPAPGTPRGGVLARAPARGAAAIGRAMVPLPAPDRAPPPGARPPTPVPGPAPRVPGPAF